MINKNLLQKSCIIITAFQLMSWGYQGHYKINSESSKSFTVKMEQFMAWTNTLAEHTSDVDYRKDEDPSKSPRHCIDSVLLADDYAQEVAGNTSSYSYKEALWNRTKSFTVPLFARASNTLAELISTAWAEAGKPR